MSVETALRGPAHIPVCTITIETERETSLVDSLRKHGRLESIICRVHRYYENYNNGLTWN